MKPEIFQQSIFGDEVFYDRNDIDRIRRDGYLEDYLLSVAALIILRWADRQETEEGAIAEFEGRDFQRALAPHLSWSHLKTLRPEELLHRLKESFESAHGDGVVAVTLSRLAGIYNLDRVDFRSLEKAVLLVGMLADGSISGGPRLAATYDSLIADYAEATGYSFGHNVTPQPIAELMVELLNPQPGETIYDPCFGGASLLATAGRRIAREGHKLSPAKWAEAESRGIYGLEINAICFALGMARIILSGINTPHLEIGDTLLRLGRRDTPKQFDIILANPPFGARVDEQYSSEGVYTKSLKSDNLFLQHVMASLSPGGRAAVLLPEGVLFGSGADEFVRRKLLEGFRVEGVISLPSGGLGLYTSIKTSIVIFRRDEPAKDVWFQTSDLNLKPGKVEDGDFAEEINRQVKLFREQKPGAHGWATPVELLAERGWTLVAERYEDEIYELIERLQQADTEIRIGKLGDLAEIFAGINYNASSMTEDASRLTYHPPVPLVRVSDLKNGRIVSPKRYLTEAGLNKAQDKHRLKPGDLLFSVTGTIGKIAQVYSTESGAIPAQNMLVIRPDQTRITPGYLLRLLQSAPYQKRFKGSSKGSLIQYLSARALQSLNIPVPSIEIQHQVGVDLPPGADASAMLQSLITGRAASELESFLLTDPAINDLLGDRQNFNPENLKGRLTAVGRSLTPWRTRAARDRFAGTALTAWLLDITHITEFLTLALEAPAQAERLAILENLRNRRMRIAFDAPEAETTTLAQRIDAINSLIHRAIEIERDRIFEEAKVTGRVEPQIIDVGKNAELTIWLKNEGPVALMKFRATDPMDEGASGSFVENRFFQPGEETPLSVVFPAQTEVGAHEILIPWKAMRIDGREIHGSAPAAVEIRSLRTSALYEEIGVNPYVVGSPIESSGNSEMFFGRKELIDSIQRALRPEGPSTVILLEGNRRAGKTSILKRLQQTTALPDWIPVYLQLQGAQGQDRRVGLPDREIFYNIARELILALHKAGRTIEVPGVGPVTLELPSARVAMLLRDKLRGEFAKDNSFELLKLIVEESIEAARPKRLLLMLDEFDKVQEGIDNGVTNPQVMDNLRFLFQNYSRLSGALAGLRRLRRVREDYWSALFGFGIVKSVGALDRREAIELITHPVATRLVFPPSVRERILSLTACQPFLIQYLCQLIFEESAITGERGITMKMVDKAAEQMIAVGEHFRHLWDQAGTERRRFLVSLVDRLTVGPDRVTFDLLSETLPLEGFEYSDLSLLANDLDILREQELLTLEDGKTYRLALPLLSMWIKKHEDALMLRQRAKDEQESGGV